MRFLYMWKYIFKFAWFLQELLEIHGDGEVE